MKMSLARFLTMGVMGVGLAISAFAQYGVRTWDAPPGEFREFERRGYLDGVQGAQRDLENHRIWDVNNRDEYRSPHVPGEMRLEYREGFERGYYAAVRHFEGVVGRR